MGGVVTTPVINQPEVAIIGVNIAIERPIVINGQVVVRTMMNLSSCFDHRFVDGFDAAQMIQALKDLLEQLSTCGLRCVPFRFSPAVLLEPYQPNALPTGLPGPRHHPPV